MRLSVVILWLVLVSSAALVAFVGAPAPAPVAPAPATGMEILRAYKCPKPEKKSVIVRGVEDNFSPAGEEHGFVRPGRRSPQLLSMSPDPRYDYDQPDHFFADSLPLPGSIASGLVVLSLRPNGDTSSDTVGFGDMSAAFVNAGAGRYTSMNLRILSTTPGWRIRGSLHSIELKDLAIPINPDAAPSDRKSRSALDLIRREKLPWLDVVVQDDSSVDFIGLAVCQEPELGNGLTLTAPAATAPENILALSCRFNLNGARTCDPYRGDTPCETLLPVLCLHPEGRTPPATLGRSHHRWSWTGGSLALTEPVSANRFARIGDVDRFCARRFGGDWRAATLHDGASMHGVSGFGDPRTVHSRVWIDILDQPYATCWKR